jgi:PKD repeat protein
MLRARLGQGIDNNIQKELAIQTRRARLGRISSSGQPEVTISISPQNPGINEQFTISGKVTFDGIPLIERKVSLLVDGTAVGTVVIGVSGYSFKTSISTFGNHIVQATCQMSLLKQQNSAQISVPITPQISINPSVISASSLVDVSITIADEASGNPVATVYSYTVQNPDGSQLLQKSSSTGADGTDSWSFTPPQIGQYIIQVTVGQFQQSATVTVTSIGSTDPGSGQGGTTPAALSLSITANPQTGNAPLSTTISATASGGTAPYQYKYQFGNLGNGDTGFISQDTASYVYVGPASYTAIITVTDSKGLQASQQIVITVNPATGSTTSPGSPGTGTGQTPQPPSGPKQPTSGTPLKGVSLVANPQNGEEPLTVTLTATVVGGTPGFVSYDFSFGDGSEGVTGSSSSSIPHTYQNSGSVVAQVTAHDLLNNISFSSTATITVSQAISYTQLSGLDVTAASSSGPAPLTENYIASPVGGKAPFIYSWFWGDGTVEVQGPSNTQSHIFTQPGTYTVKVIVQDSTGATYTVGFNVTVTAPPTPIPPIAPGEITDAWYDLPFWTAESATIDWSCAVINADNMQEFEGVIQAQVFDPSGNRIFVQNQNIIVAAANQNYAGFISNVTTPGLVYTILMKVFNQDGVEMSNELTKTVQT